MCSEKKPIVTVKLISYSSEMTWASMEEEGTQNHKTIPNELWTELNNLSVNSAVGVGSIQWWCQNWKGERNIWYKRSQWYNDSPKFPEQDVKNE